MVSRLGLLPVFLVSLTVLAFILSYVWAVYRHDVTPIVPFISDTGANSPESCLFSQLLNLSAFLTFFIMYIRYKDVENKLREVEDEESRWPLRLNQACEIMGMLAAFGVSMVANFQDNSEISAVHFIGAVLAFGLGVLYCILQTVLSYRMCRDYSSVARCRARLAICVLCGAAGICMGVSWTVASQLWKAHHQAEEQQTWKPGDIGYTAHLCSTTFEWILAFCFFAFFLTYVGEFNNLEVEIIFRGSVPHPDLEANGQRAPPPPPPDAPEGRERADQRHSINNAFSNSHGQDKEEAGESTRLLR